MDIFGQYILKHIRMLNGMLIYLLFGILCGMLLCGCKGSQTVSNNEPSVVIEEDNLAAMPSADPTPTSTPTPKPSASISREDPLTDADAQTLLKDRFGNHDYTMTLLTENIIIEGDSYFAYEISDGAIALEPIVIVNKYTGRVSCIDSDGDIISFANFPSTSSFEDVTCDWNGTFIRTDAKGVENSRLTLLQNNDSSFTFILTAKDSITSIHLCAIAYIDNYSAAFIDDSNRELIFLFESDNITIMDDGAFDRNGLSFAGTYQFESYDYEASLFLTKDDAVAEVTSLTSIQTYLDHEISYYDLVTLEQTVVVHDRICYCIEAYDTTTFSGNKNTEPVLVAQFYVTADGNRIYEYPSNSEKCILINIY